MKTTVIKCGLLFWNGNSYAKEYPDAKTYKNWPSVKEVQIATISAVAHGLGDALSVYRNYGSANQDRYQFVGAIRNEGVIVSEYGAEVKSPNKFVAWRLK